MSDQNESVKYTIDADASKFEAAAKRAKKAADDISKSNAGESLTKQTNSAAKAVDNLRSSYTQLERSRSSFDKNQAGSNEITKRQISNLKQQEGYLVKLSGREQDYSKTLQTRLNLQDKLNKSTQQFSAHSQRQASQLRGIAMQLGGSALSSAGAYGRQLYGAGIGTYQALNNQASFDPALTAAQRNYTRSQVNLGSQLSGYQQFKMNAQAAINNSPFAAPLAIGGDVLGNIAGPAGGLLQLAGGVKALRGGAGFLGGAARVAGAAGTAAETGAAADFGLQALVGGGSKLGGLGGLLSKVGPLAGALGMLTAIPAGAIGGSWASQNIFHSNGLGDIFNPLDEGKKGAMTAMGGEAGLQNYLKTTKPEDQKKVTDKLDQQVKALQELQKSRPSWQGGEGGIGPDTAREKKAIDALAKSGLDETAVKSAANNVFKANELLGGLEAQRNAIKTGTFDADKQKAKQQENSFKQDWLNSPEVKSQMTRMANGVADFFQDSQRQETQVRRQFSRGMEDINLSRSRAKEDRAFQVEGFGIQSGRIEQDYSRTKGREQADYTRNVGRAQFDNARAIQQNELQVYKVKRDFAIQSQRLTDDTARNRLRTEQDFTKNSTRLEEDSSRSSLRLTEDLNRDKERSDAEYSRNKTVQLRENARNEADLNRNYKDNLLSILAPQVASSKIYQVRKLQRNYALEKSRMQEDQAQASQDLERGRQYSLEDRARSGQRGFEDINREATRGRADLNQENSRATADQAREAGRASQDLQRQTTDSLVESQLQLRDTQINFARTMADLNLQHVRSVQDTDLQYVRSKQDLAREETQAGREFTRTLDDLDRSAKRLKEDFDTQIEDIQISRDRKTRDTTQDLTDLARDTSNQTGFGFNVQDFVDKYFKGNSHAQGLPSVPYDGYKAILHKDEMVVPALAANVLRNFNPDANTGAIGAMENPNSPWQKFMQQVAGFKPGQVGGTAAIPATNEAMPDIDSIRAAMSASLRNTTANNGPAVFRPDYDFSKDIHNYTSGASQSLTAAAIAAGGTGGALGSSAGDGSTGATGGYSGIGGGGGNFLPRNVRSGWAGMGPQYGWNNGSINMGGYAPSGYRTTNGGYGYQPPMGRGGFGGGSGINYNPTYNVSDRSLLPKIKELDDQHRQRLDNLMSGTNAALY